METTYYINVYSVIYSGTYLKRIEIKILNIKIKIDNNIPVMAYKRPKNSSVEIY